MSDLPNQDVNYYVNVVSPVALGFLICLLFVIFYLSEGICGRQGNSLGTELMEFPLAAYRDHPCPAQGRPNSRPVEKHFQEGSAELQIPGFARDDKKGRVVVREGRLPKDRVVVSCQRTGRLLKGGSVVKVRSQKVALSSGNRPLLYNNPPLSVIPKRSRGICSSPSASPSPPQQQSSFFSSHCWIMSIFG